MSVDDRHLLVHIIYRLDVGGLENGLVNLINLLDRSRYRHAVICLLDATEFRRRIAHDDVEVISLNKRPGKGFTTYWGLWRHLRRLRPALVHTRNLPTADLAIIAAMARVPIRVHGEHGRDVIDIDGTNPKYRFIRRVMRLFIHQYVALSKDLARWLVESIGVPATKIEQIYNGVDMARFRPPASVQADRSCLPFNNEDAFVVGSIGRLVPVKDYGTLVEAFAKLCTRVEHRGIQCRLVLVGSGPQRGTIESLAASLDVADRVWLAGSRDDVPRLLGALDVFVLPSLGEGVSNTILEAMACARPVIATRVGGNPELVQDGETGALFRVGDALELAEILERYALDESMRATQGQQGRQRVEKLFAIDVMIERYDRLYRRLLERTAPVEAH